MRSNAGHSNADVVRPKRQAGLPISGPIVKAQAEKLNRGGFGGGSVGTAFPRPKSLERSDLPMQRASPVFLQNLSR